MCVPLCFVHLYRTVGDVNLCVFRLFWIYWTGGCPGEVAGILFANLIFMGHSLCYLPHRIAFDWYSIHTAKSIAWTTDRTLSSIEHELVVLIHTSGFYLVKFPSDRIQVFALVFERRSHAIAGGCHTVESAMPWHTTWNSKMFIVSAYCVGHTAAPVYLFLCILIYDSVFDWHWAKIKTRHSISARVGISCLFSGSTHTRILCLCWRNAI